MRVIGASSEDEMIAVFLSGELRSSRFGDAIVAALGRAGAERPLVEAPDLGDPAANALRRRLLAETRGYGTGEGLFGGFPADVIWHRAALTRAEVEQIVYIDYDYWVELSGGTRSPADAARRIAEGIDVFGVSTSGFVEAAGAIAGGGPIDELILVSVGASAPLVVLEGHVRLTVYALRPELLPRELEVLLGTSPAFVDWGLY